MRIRLLRDRDFTPPADRRLTIAYCVGHEVTIRRVWGDLLVADGDAEEIEVSSRPSDIAENDG